MCARADTRVMVMLTVILPVMLMVKLGASHAACATVVQVGQGGKGIKEGRR